MTRLRGTALVLRALDRPGFTILVVFAELVGLLQRGHLPSAVDQVAVTVAVLAWAMASAALNDVADEAIDKVNLVADARRVLVTGLASRRQLVTVSVGLNVLALAAAAVAGWTVVVVIAAGIALSAAYSLRPIRLSDRGLLTSLILPLGYVVLPFSLGAVAGSPVVTTTGWWALCGLGTAFTGRLALKDFRDVDGDRLFGKRTLLVRHGRRATCGFAAGLYAAGSVPLLIVTSGSATAMADAAVLSVLTVALIARLARHDAGDRLTISDVALLGRGQLAIVVVALAIGAHRLSPATAALASTSILLCTLFSAWIDHSRRRYEPAAATCASAVSLDESVLAVRGAPGA